MHHPRAIFEGFRLRFLSSANASSHQLSLNDFKSGKKQPDLGMLRLGGED